MDHSFGKTCSSWSRYLIGVPVGILPQVPRFLTGLMFGYILLCGNRGIFCLVQEIGPYRGRYRRVCNRISLKQLLKKGWVGAGLQPMFILQNRFIMRWWLEVEQDGGLISLGGFKYHQLWEFSFFLCLKGKLLTHDVMIRRGLQCALDCVMCQSCNLETTSHIFFPLRVCNNILEVVWQAAGLSFILGRKLGPANSY